MTLVPRDYALWHVERAPAEGGRYHRDLEYRRRQGGAVPRHCSTTAEAIVPGLREHADWQEAATP